MSAAWAPLLNPAMQERAPDEYLVLPNVRSPKARMPIARQLCNVDDDSPALAKLRDTWVIDQLTRVPVGILTHVAGFGNLTSLSTRYGTFISTADDSASAPYYDTMVGEER